MRTHASLGEKRATESKTETGYRADLQKTGYEIGLQKRVTKPGYENGLQKTSYRARLPKQKQKRASELSTETDYRAEPQTI